MTVANYLISSSVGSLKLGFMNHQLESGPVRWNSAHGFSRFLIEDSEWAGKAFLTSSILILGGVAGLLEEPVDEDLEEVPGEVVGPLGVGPGHLVEGALLAGHEVGGDLADTELRPGPNHDKVGDGELVLVDRAAVHVVLDRLDGRS